MINEAVRWLMLLDQTYVLSVWAEISLSKDIDHSACLTRFCISASSACNTS